MSIFVRIKEQINYCLPLPKPKEAPLFYVILFVAVVGLVGIVGYEIHNANVSAKYEYGTVVERKHTPPWVQVVPIYHSTGKGGGYFTYVPVYHPESWSAVLRGEGGDGEEFTVRLNEEVYESWSEGERVKNPDYE